MGYSQSVTERVESRLDCVERKRATIVKEHNTRTRRMPEKVDCGKILGGDLVSIESGVVEIDSLDDGQYMIKRVSSRIAYHVEGKGKGKVTQI